MELEFRLGQRLGQRRGFLDHGICPAQQSDEIGRRQIALDLHGAAGRMDDEDAVPHRRQPHRLPGMRVMLEEIGGFGDGARQTAGLQQRGHDARGGVAAGQQAIDPQRRAAGTEAEGGRILPARGGEDRKLGTLPAFDIGELEPVAGKERQHHRTAARDAIALHPRLEPGQAGLDQPGPCRQRQAH